MCVHIYVKVTERYCTTMVVVINTKRKFPRSGTITETELLHKCFTNWSPHSSHEREWKSA